MRGKCLAALAVILMVAVAFAPSAEGAAAVTDYRSQLDANGEAVYSEVSSSIEASLASPSNQLSFVIVLGNPVLFSSEDEAKAYASETVNSALAAIYYTNPEAVWLWDLPVSAVEIESSVKTVTVSGGQYFVASEVRFTLTVPDRYADDSSTEANETASVIEKLRSAREQYSGSLSDKVKAISDRLHRVTVTDDEEGAVSNAYDALVGGSSSSAGIAAAFTYLCAYSGVTTVMTVAGDILSSDGSSERGYWNVIVDGDSVYGTDVTIYDGDDRSPLLAGFTTQVSGGWFGSVHVADLDLSAENSLQAPSLSYTGYEWPDDRSILEKYGLQIVTVLVMVIIVAVILYAMRSGEL